MPDYLACFDITDDKNRTKLGNKLGAFGNRVQYSVFEISVKTPKEFEQLAEELKQWLEEGDSLRFYHLCQRCREKSQDQSGDRIAYFPAGLVI